MSKSAVIILLLVNFILIRQSLQQLTVDMDVNRIEETIQQTMKQLNVDTNVNSIEDNRVADYIGTCHCVTKCDKCSDNAFIQMNNEDLCNSTKEEILCCEETLPLNPMSSMLILKMDPISTTCGYRAANAVTNLKDFDKYNSAPWMVALTIDPKLGMISGTGAHGYCGGSIIHPRVVLTAAHCLDDIQNNVILIRAGEWNSNFDQNSKQTRKVLTRRVHPGYNSEKRWNDLALLFLDTEFVMNANVGIACLGSLENLKNVDYNNCVLNGWGKISKENKNHPNIVKEILLKVDYNKMKCLEDLNKIFNGPEASYISFICGYKNLDNEELISEDVFCDNDNGGPLVCPSNGRYIQFGIASWQYNCDNVNVPALFTEVGPAFQWIQNEMSLHSLELESILS